MTQVKPIRLRGDSLPNMPWEEKPAGYPGVCWRYSGNPVIRRDHLPKSNSIFNSAVVPFEGKYAGVFRVDDTRRCMRIHAGFSDDGLRWDIEPEAITFDGDDPEALRIEYAYDPRVVWIDDRYWVTWCNGYHGPTIGVAWTRDFRSFTKCENAFLPFNRNGVLFPKKVNGKYLMLSRPSDNGHTPFGDIFVSASPDMEHWGCHRHVMSTNGAYAWQSTKIGAGPIPIETSEGWLMIYHGVLTSCNGFVYSFGAALLDLDEPWKVIARGAPYILSPQAPYELAGDVPNVTFPCAALVDEDTGRIAIYYGCADTHTGLAFCHAAELVAWVKENNGFPVQDVAPGVQR